MATIKIYADPTPMNPRTDWDPMGTLAYKRDWRLSGDKNEEINDPIEWLAEKLDLWDDQLDRLRERHGAALFEYSRESEKSLFEDLQHRFYKKYIALPVYIYEHSGITINTSGFSCRWDSGQLGWIYISREDVRKEYGWKRITAKREKLIESYLDGEIEVFDQYLRGDVYGFVLNEGEEGEDSCWGFFGDDFMNNGIADHIPKEYHPILEAMDYNDIDYSMCQ